MKKPQPLDVGMMMSEVATRLRSGASIEQAWQRTLGQFDQFAEQRIGTHGQIMTDDGVPYPLRNIADLSWWQRRKYRLSKAATAALPAAFVVCRMSQVTGAPVADVFDSCARGITEAGEAAAARDIALAGPQTSAFMLAFLPIVGLVFGTLLGARPVEFFISSIIGFGVLCTGLITEGLGVWWVWRLIVKARSESEEL
ncbi:type II secretion system F family protein [Arcanobacterium buesumense]|uniref:Type II secretion system protein GspF domain-containing protein n=1 Tax=Arcanobacterium buesumense TaxID=2722751 RepID=A0A6H2ENA4_9ACTO|nr:hypothetical protein [Arcanobacterium buesumense]QJC22532.1 hypothetical protein HC352_08465 [Arcanobacterium buesumense]